MPGMDETEITYDLELGHDHFLQFYQWAPDRELNPQYKDLPDVPKAGATIQHRKKDGSLCFAAVSFTNVGMPPQEGAGWKVEAWDPLTLTPSLRCMVEGCGDHGFIRKGKWVPA